MLASGFYFLIYIFISFFIFIGETTQHLILFVIRLMQKIVLFITRFIWGNKHVVVDFGVGGVRGLMYVLRKLIGFVFFILHTIIVLPLRFVASLFSPELRFFILGIILCLAGIFIYGSYRFVVELPSPTDIGKLNYPLSTHMYDRNGKLLYEIYKEQNRTLVSLKELPAYVYRATIAIEDKDFYTHGGVSPIGGILRAAKEMIVNKNIQGGSTLTQQLVKSALLTPEQTVERKLKEILLALWTEKLYTKDQILEMYLNQVPYGGSSYGVEEAAKSYFSKSAKELTIAEAAFLAGMPQAPSVYSPYTNPALAQKRRNDVIKKMYELHFITSEQKNEALQEELKVSPPQVSIQAPHFVFYIKEYLEQQYGIQRVEEGGLNVMTSLDLDIQKQAETILREELEKVAYLNISNGAILVTKPSTGEILAMVGSADYFAEPSGAFNVTTALRQPGSSIKPVTYALGLEEEKYTAASTIDDVPTAFQIPGSVPYVPVNYDGKFHGRVPYRYALANSFNIPAVKVLQTVGVDEMVSFAKKLGITSWDDSSRFGLSLTLGGGEVKMIDMATVYGTFANQGRRVATNGVLRIYNARNETMYETAPRGTRVLSQETSYILSDIMSDNFARRWEFGTQSALEIPGKKVAVKTGTTDMKKDNWTIGYTPDFVVAVWVGNNDNTPMNQYLASGITGAAPIWNRVMTYLLTKYGANWYDKPMDVVEKQCFFGKKEYFIRGTENKASCSVGVLNTTPGVSPTKNP
jgi:1A family penicillin-binding protein